jgi:adenylate cyclase
VRIGVKVKLAVVLSGTLVLVTFSLAAVMITHQRASLEEQLRSMAATVTEEFAGNSKIPLLEKDSLAMNLLVQNILRHQGISEAYILNENFLIEGSDDLQEVGRAYYVDRESVLRAEGPPPWAVRDEDGAVAFASPIVFQETTVGYTVVSFSGGFIEERVRHAMTRAAGMAVLAVILVSAISIPMATGLLRPVFRLFKGTREIAGGNLDYRIPVKSDDEMGDLVASFNRMASELKKKEILKGVFNRYVSPRVADEILKEPERIRLGGDRREVTVLFADIRDFTSLSGRLTPEETVEILNSYFTVVTEVVFSFNGTVDKFIGDAVMGVFGSPVRSEVHLEQGVCAALAVKGVVSELNALRLSRGLAPIRMGIGLDTGTVIVGNMGSKVRMEYTAIGEPVNMASRLTSIAKAGEILVTGRTYEAIGDNAAAERLPEVSIKGAPLAVEPYNILELKGSWKEAVEEAVRKVSIAIEGEIEGRDAAT